MQLFLGQVGGLLATTGFLGVWFDLKGRRALSDEVLAIANLSEDIKRAGVKCVTGRYLEEVAWVDLFKGAHELDIMVAYGRTWRNTHQDRLQKAVQSGATVRVFLPDPGNELMVQVLADRFGYNQEKVRQEIEDAIQFYRELGSSMGKLVDVRLHAVDPVFSCYRFDGRAVITLYSHARKRHTLVPTLVVGEGDLYTYVHDEIEALAAESKPTQWS
ncbi:MAG: hypothetical protein QG608_2114 [Actinomycetota bacterium]|nr:hypothetical protein [Actinomycetota bacterium]